MSLHRLITSSTASPPPQLRLSDNQWDSLLVAVEEIDAIGIAVDNEAAWTFLCAYGYVAAGASESLTRLLVECEPRTASPDVWIEARPVPPRARETHTRVDLAAGDIRLRPGTEAGIQFDSARCGPSSWVLHTEAKWLSDMSGFTTHDPLRGQLLRDIENALVLQDSGLYPSTVHFTLLTPLIFKRNRRSRGYGLVFSAYQEDGKKIAEDLKSHRHPVRNNSHWKYPTPIESRIAALRLHWVDYETILRDMPETAFKHELLKIATRDRSVLEL